MLHGFVLYAVLAWTATSLPLAWRLGVAVFVEAVWELVENSDFVVRRYREGTAALGYGGDAVVNSFGDLAACGLGFVLAYHLGARRTLAVFAATEAVLLLWIRDSLLLNVLMLIHPVEEIKAWQMGV